VSLDTGFFLTPRVIEVGVIKSHAGRYTSKKAADEYADYLKKEGYIAIVDTATVYDVFIFRNKERGLE